MRIFYLSSLPARHLEDQVKADEELIEPLLQYIVEKEVVERTNNTFVDHVHSSCQFFSTSVVFA